MKTKDILELRRRFTKDNCTFTRLCGCYVNADKVKVTTFNKTFLNLEDEEFYKYLDIAKSIFKGKIGEKLGDNLLVCSFKDEQYRVGTRGEQLIQLRGNMKNEEALEAFYDVVIDSYDYVGNYLILLFHDVYDVMKKASDNAELEESEEVYEYLLCAICPVGLTTPGLEYREDENRIAPRIRDWVVRAPETGFLYPAFTDRSEDQEHVLFYTKDAAHPHHELMECGLWCKGQLTGTEKRNKFEKCIERVVGEELAEDILMSINAAMWEMPADEDETAQERKKAVDVLLLEEILSAAVEPGLYSEEIKEQYIKEFGENYPEGKWLFNKKYYKKAVEKRQKKGITELLEKAGKELERITGEESDLTKRIFAAVTR